MRYVSLASMRQNSKHFYFSSNCASISHCMWTSVFFYGKISSMLQKMDTTMANYRTMFFHSAVSEKHEPDYPLWCSDRSLMEYYYPVSKWDHMNPSWPRGYNTIFDQATITGGPRAQLVGNSTELTTALLLFQWNEWGADPLQERRKGRIDRWEQEEEIVKGSAIPLRGDPAAFFPCPHRLDLWRQDICSQKSHFSYAGWNLLHLRGLPEWPTLPSS